MKQMQILSKRFGINTKWGQLGSTYCNIPEKVLESFWNTIDDMQMRPYGEWATLLTTVIENRDSPYTLISFVMLAQMASQLLSIRKFVEPNLVAPVELIV